MAKIYLYWHRFFYMLHGKNLFVLAPIFLALHDIQAYNRSDYNAWRCGDALKDRLKILNASHNGKVRVLAHSQGNVITGEALRRSPANLIHTYIATQAAVSANCYQEAPEYFDSYTTPNVRRNYSDTLSGHHAPSR